MAPLFTQTFAERIATPEGGDYLNPSSITDGGQVRFSILSEEALTGYEIWFIKSAGGKTKRVVPDEPTPELLRDLEKAVEGVVDERDGKAAIKPCACLFVFDYEDEKVKLLSVTQKSILNELFRLTSDPDYEPLSAWDIKLSRKGQKMDTKYMVSMVPSRRADAAVGKRVFEAWDAACAAGYNLEALIEGGSPFGGSR